ncbi:MAG: hypothetical protein A2166_02805 [Omnitrophica WOR_2 bacterium RBG_13_41_10]|nr:MAG: hypothetical protein A2166_02805 [Omnitrophica WOR_2 bacterium RBG_13_41_10]
MKKINIGVIGCGHWGPNFIRNFSRMADVNMQAVCDINPDKLIQIKKEYRRIHTYKDYHNLLDNNKLNAVVISTPADTHHKITKEALEKNKHVLVEKPLSLEIAKIKDLIRVAKRTKKILMVGHTFLYNPAVNKVKEIIAKKELGKIYYIHSRRTNLGPLRKDVNAIWDLSPHDISIINYLLGQMPEHASAYSQRFLSHKLEDVGFIILKYPNRVLAHIHVSWLDPKKVREMTIIGSKKMLVYDDTSVNEPIKVYDKKVMARQYKREYHSFKEFQLIIRDGKVEMPRVNIEEPLKIECQHFIDCVTHGRKPLTAGENGLAVLRIMDAINKSIVKKGSFIRIP